VAKSVAVDEYPFSTGWLAGAWADLIEQNQSLDTSRWLIEHLL
jgi:hypothetical protein